MAEIRIEQEPGWTARVVPNKFPALQIGQKVSGSDRRHLVGEGYGFHEVIIENPRHDADLVSMTNLEIEAVVSLYRNRSKHLLMQPGIEAAVLFRNHGRGGGSQSHPHAQLVALGFVPPGLKSLADWGYRYYSEKKRCATCEEIAIECDLKSRIVEDVKDFLVLVPFAAEHPCEMWVVPKQHQASFLDLTDAKCHEFALLLRRTLRRLRRARDDPPYNFVIDSAPRGHLQSPWLHWRLRIAPDLATWGGFELGAGIAINPSAPEHDASLLRITKCETID